MEAKRVIYLPLESYQERYTSLMSSKGGWTESTFNELGVNFLRIEGESSSGVISSGSVLDAYDRSSWALSQIQTVINLIKYNEITDNDIIYTEDFYHPGIDSLFYIRHITNKKFKVACFIHAQSIDESDFTYPMRSWLRSIEVGLSHGYDFVFTCSKILKQKAVKAGYSEDRIFVTGLPYNSKRLLEKHPIQGEKENFVLFSSRFDAEKNPNFFLDIVESCPDINFKLVKPRKILSNDPAVINRANSLKDKLSNFEIVDTSDKTEYYNLLNRAKVQFNCAEQDWVSWTLLEATTYNCLPLYPIHKDFPEELNYNCKYLYRRGDKEEAIRLIRLLMSKKRFDIGLSEIAKRHNLTWSKQLKIMGII